MDIKKLRSKKNLTQVELAKLIGVSSQTVKLWEWGDMSPNEENMKKLEEIATACYENDCEHNFTGQCDGVNINCEK